MHRIELKLCAQNNLIKCSICILTAPEKDKKKKKKKSKIQKTEFSAFISKRLENCEENQSVATDSSLKKGHLNVAAVDRKVSCFFCY